MDALKTNAESITFEEWRNAAQNFGAYIPETLARIAWWNNEDPTEYAANPPMVFARRINETSNHNSHEISLNEFMREIDNIPDASLVEIPERSHTAKDVWYTRLRGGSYMSDPDFGTAGHSPEDAIKLCANKIREDIVGIGKYAPHFNYYDLVYRFLPVWTRSELI